VFLYVVREKELGTRKSYVVKWIIYMSAKNGWLGCTMESVAACVTVGRYTATTPIHFHIRDHMTMQLLVSGDGVVTNWHIVPAPDDK
jgi:uncharacterized protein (DUF2062 family)